MTPGKPTVVLVHGAFADSSRWNGAWSWRATPTAAETTAVMAAIQRPVTDAALAEGASAAAGKDIPSWVLVATEDRNIPAQTQVFMAERTNATVMSLTYSYAVSVSRRGDVARLINEAAQATA
ncbi:MULTISPECIES: hypothetical protein [unclassified Streptomyces]|uniref:hypothetical protein n=1 Tax=unclassified Streptomyces TaxID=2593676 RepID=UPI001FFD7ED8|nr:MULTISPECIES: hypothetical protein [unclassified Streptomyces]